jgi:hypothetical protein
MENAFMWPKMKVSVSLRLSRETEQWMEGESGERGDLSGKLAHRVMKVEG